MRNPDRNDAVPAAPDGYFDRGRTSPRGLLEDSYKDDANLMDTAADYVAVIFRHFVLLLIVFSIVFACVAAYTFAVTPIYQSASTLLIRQFQPGIDQALGFWRFTHSGSFLETELYVMKSAELLREFVNRSAVVKSVPCPLDGKKGGWFADGFHPLIGKAYASADRSDDEACGIEAKRQFLLAHFSRNLSVSQVDDDTRFGTNLVKVALDAKSPTNARTWLSSYIDFYVAQNLEKLRSEIGATRSALQEEADMMEQKVAQAEKELIEFVNQHGIVSKEDAGLGRVLRVLDESTRRITRSQEDQKRLADTTGPTYASPGGGRDAAVEDPLVSRLKQELATLELEHAKMASLYSRSYPKATQARAKIEILKEKLAEVQEDSTSAALEAARKEEAIVAETAEKAKEEAAKINVLETRHAILKKRVESEKRMYERVLDALKKTDIRLRSVFNNVEILSRPKTPSRPIKPDIAKNLSMGALIALFCGLAAAYTAEFARRKIRAPRDYEDSLQIATLGVVPDLGKVSDGWTANGGDQVHQLIAKENDYYPFADACSNIFNSLLYSEGTLKSRTYMVTSSIPREGKTLLAVSLAATAGLEGALRTIIVDTDFRKPSLWRIFGHDETDPGLVTVLRNANVRLRDVIHKSRVDNLYYMLAGGTAKNPRRLFRSKNMERVLEQLSRSFDLVILDCPPALLFPDVRILSAYAEGALVVARQGWVSEIDLKQTVAILRSDGTAPPVGVILNAVRNRSLLYGIGSYRNYKGYDYYYGKTKSPRVS